MCGFVVGVSVCVRPNGVLSMCVLSSTGVRGTVARLQHDVKCVTDLIEPICEALRFGAAAGVSKTTTTCLCLRLCECVSVHARQRSTLTYSL